MIEVAFALLIPGDIGFTRGDGGFRLKMLPWPIALGEYLYQKYVKPPVKGELEKVSADAVAPAL